MTADSGGTVKCQPCAGSGKRHSIFDFCNCKPPCDDLGICAWCGGAGEHDGSGVIPPQSGREG